MVDHEQAISRNLHRSFDCGNSSRLHIQLLVRATERLKAKIETAEYGLTFGDLIEDLATLRFNQHVIVYVLYNVFQSIA